jgi:hypothetical protein
MARSLRRQVRERARNRCEYCHLPQQLTVLTHEIDHVIAKKHRGAAKDENLCLACYYCNGYKGSNIAGVDPKTGRITRLFNPRHDDWAKHFQWRGPLLLGRTAIGRVTIEVMRINLPDRVAHRRMLINAGLFP